MGFIPNVIKQFSFSAFLKQDNIDFIKTASFLIKWSLGATITIAFGSRLCILYEANAIQGAVFLLTGSKSTFSFVKSGN